MKGLRFSSTHSGILPNPEYRGVRKMTALVIVGWKIILYLGEERAIRGPCKIWGQYWKVLHHQAKKDPAHS